MKRWSACANVSTTRATIPIVGHEEVGENFVDLQEAIHSGMQGIAGMINTVVPQAIDAADVHFVLSPTALSRAWCCYELALFHRRAMAEEGSPTLRSFVAPIGTVPYRGFSYRRPPVPGTSPCSRSGCERTTPEESTESMRS